MRYKVYKGAQVTPCGTLNARDEPHARIRASALWGGDAFSYWVKPSPLDVKGAILAGAVLGLFALGWYWACGMANS